MNPIERFERLNNTWVDLKHRISHWRKRHSRESFPPIEVPNPHNVLIAVIDCLRADHVSAFGYDRPTTPNLQKLNAGAFSNAKAASTWTFPSIPSLLTGRYPYEHGARFDSDPRDLSSEEFPRELRNDIRTLPDILESAGYDTGLVTAIPMAEKAVGDRFQDVTVRYTDATERVGTAMDWIDGRDRWFCYLHVGDPHAPLDVREEDRERFDVPDMDGVYDWRFRESIEGDEFEAYRNARIRAYDAAIRGADAALGELFTELDEDTILIVCGDHGEAFWEHPDWERQFNDDPRGYYGTDHGHSVFEELARVPLWVRAPGVKRGQTNRAVSLVDVFPTVLEGLGSDIPDTVSGHSLDVPGSDDDVDDRPLLCEETGYGYNQRALWLGEQKIIAVPSTGEMVAFDLDGYLENSPLDGVPANLRTALQEFPDGFLGEETVSVDASTRDHLEELGYLE